MDKHALRQQIVAALEADLDLTFAAAQAAHAAATHEECIADNKYDTLGLEASYLAQGQANRAQEIRAALEHYRQLELRTFDEFTPIRLSALVTLEEDNGNQRLVFLGPDAGGMKVVVQGHAVVVITPVSPLGRNLIGKSCGDVLTHDSGPRTREWTVVNVR